MQRIPGLVQVIPFSVGGMFQPLEAPHTNGDLD